MVGVPKSKGCATCRQRKIRCHEDWPICQQCRRGHRECPGPSNPYGKFMDEGPRQRARGEAFRTAVSPSVRPAEQARPPRRPNHHEDHHEDHPVPQIPCTDIETVRTKLTTSGAMFSTMKMVSDEPQRDSNPRCLPGKQCLAALDAREKKRLQRQKGVFGGLPQTFPLSGLDVLTSKLVATLNEEGPSNQIKLFGPFIGEVPRRLGSTAALNDAAACLTTTHDAIIRKHSKTRINPQLYAKALRSLHAAIQDPDQLRSTSTLCATVLLAITEAYAVGVCGTNRNFITHLGGAARILELRGPKEFQNPSSFERALLRAITVGVGLDAIFTGKEDILATREWQDIAFDTAGVSEPRASMFKISRVLSLLPSLTRDVRAYFASSSSSPSSSITRDKLLRRAERLYKMLGAVKPYIDATLADPQRVRRVAASPDLAGLWPMAYRFADAGVAFVLWFFWNMRMITASLIIGLHRHHQPPSSPSTSSSSSSSSSSSFATAAASARIAAALERDVVAMAHDVCMSWEHARAARPLGAMYIDVGLIVAHGVLRREPARQRWVRRALAELTAGHPGEGTGEGIAGREFDGADWTAERVEWLGRWFTAGCVEYVDAGGVGGSGEAGEGDEEEEEEEEEVVVEGGSPLSAASASSLASCGASGGGRVVSPTEGIEEERFLDLSSSWDEWAFAGAGQELSSDWDVSMQGGSSDDASFRGGDAESVASASTATGTATTSNTAFVGGSGAVGMWSPDSLASLADTDSFLVLQPMGMRVRWHTPATTATMLNYGGGVFSNSNNNFNGMLKSRPFVA